MRGRGQPRWRVLPLEMLSTCTCYSRLHWRWFGYVSPFYCTTWSSLVLARFRILMDHMSAPIVSHVSFLLAHVSCCGWVTCHFFIGPCVVFFIGPRGMTTIPCVSFFYTTTCLDAVYPRVSILLGHMSHPKLPTFLFLIWPRGRMDLYHVFCLYWPTCPVVAVTRVIHWFVHVSDSYLTTCLY